MINSKYVLVILIAFLVSCSQENVEIETLNGDDKLEWISFKSKEDFNEFLVKFSEFSQYEKENYTRLMYGIKSLAYYHGKGMDLIDVDDYESFYQLKKEIPLAFDEVFFDNSILYELPVSYTLSCLLNKDGVYQIGDSLYKHIVKGYYVVHVNDYRGDDLIENSENAVFQELPMLKNQFSFKTAYDPTNSKRRIVARLYKVRVGLLDEYDARTTSQSTLGSLSPWVQNSIEEVGLSYANTLVTLENGHEINVYGGSWSKTNSADIRRSGIVAVGANNPPNYSISSIEIKHWGLRGANTMIIDKNELLRP